MCCGVFNSNCTETLSKFMFSNNAECGRFSGVSCPSKFSKKFRSMSPLGASTLITFGGPVGDEARFQHGRDEHARQEIEANDRLT